MPANTNPVRRWTNATLGLPLQTPVAGREDWNTAVAPTGTKGLVKYCRRRRSVTRRRKISTDSCTGSIRENHVESMARGQTGMSRSKTFTDFSEYQKPKYAGKVVNSKERRGSLTRKQQLPPINGTKSPPLAFVRPISAKPNSDDNVRRSREDLVAILPQALRRAISTNSLASIGSSPTRPDIFGSLQSKRHSSPIIIPPPERRVSFEIGTSGKSSGDGGESMVSGQTKSSGMNSIQPTSKRDQRKALRPVSVMTNFSSSLSSVIEQPVPITENGEPEKPVENTRSHNITNELVKPNRVKSNVSKLNSTGKNETKPWLKKPFVVKRTYKNNDKWRGKTEQKNGFDYNRNEEKPSKMGRRFSTPVRPQFESTKPQFDSISEYDKPNNTHKTLTFVYDETKGKSAMVEDTPRNIDFLKSRLDLESWEQQSEGNDEHCENDTLPYAPLTIENIQSRDDYDDDDIPDKNHQIWLWVKNGYIYEEVDE